MMSALMKKRRTMGCAFYEKVRPINVGLDADLLLEGVDDTLAS